MRWVLDVAGATTGAVVILVTFRITRCTTCPDRSVGRSGTLLHQPIVFALQAAEEFEQKHEADDADA